MEALENQQLYFLDWYSGIRVFGISRTPEFPNFISDFSVSEEIPSNFEPQTHQTIPTASKHPNTISKHATPTLKVPRVIFFNNLFPAKAPANAERVAARSSVKSKRSCC